MNSFKLLFSPIKIGKTEVRNRIVMPPMSLGYGAGLDGTVTERGIHYYEARAKGGVGLVIVEATAVNDVRKHLPISLGLFDDKQIPSWRKLAKAVHGHGAKLAAQLIDGGPESLFFLLSLIHI